MVQAPWDPESGSILILECLDCMSQHQTHFWVCGNQQLIVAWIHTWVKITQNVTVSLFNSFHSQPKQQMGQKLGPGIPVKSDSRVFKSVCSSWEIITERC